MEIKRCSQPFTNFMILNINGLKIYYETLGKGEPVVLLHGWGTDSSTLRPTAQALRETLERRTYTLDFPGFGFSDQPPQAWSVEDYTRLLLAFLDENKLEQVDLLGHSFGGRVAIKLAAQHPERIQRLVLVDSAGIRPQRTLSYYARVYYAKTLKILAHALPGKPLKKSLQALLSSQGSSDYRKASGVMRQTFVMVVNEDLRHHLPAITCPTLLVWGERDDSTPLSDAQIMQKMIPNARLEVIPGTGHFSFMENFASFRNIILAFLSNNPS